MTYGIVSAGLESVQWPMMRGWKLHQIFRKLTHLNVIYIALCLINRKDTLQLGDYYLILFLFYSFFVLKSCQINLHTGPVTLGIVRWAYIQNSLFSSGISEGGGGDFINLQTNIRIKSILRIYSF